MSFFRILGVALLSGAAVMAQTVQLEPVEVLATPIVADTSIDDWAGRTTTVGQEQIDALNAQDLASALRRTPGVKVKF